MKKLILFFSIIKSICIAQDSIYANPHTINQGQSTTLSDIVNTSYSWSNGATTQVITVSPSTTTTYTVTRTTNEIMSIGQTLITVIPADTNIITIGQIFNDSFNTNSSANWTQGGTGSFTWDTVNGDLLCSGGTSDFSKYLGYNKWATCLEQHTITALFKVTTAPSLTSGGIWFGIRSINPMSRISYACFFNATNVAANSGKTFIYTASNSLATQFTQRAKSTLSVGIALNDEIQMTITRNFLTLTVVTVNLTQHDSSIVVLTDSLTAPSVLGGLNNTGYITIYLNGGTQSVHNIAYSSAAHKNIKTLNVSASIGHGFFAGSLANRYTTVGYANGGSHEVSAGGSDRTIEVLARMPEILLQNPKYLLLEIGANDINFGGQTQTQINNNYDAIRNAIVNNGITIIHLYATPFHNKNITPINTHIASAWPNDRFVDDYTPLWSGTGTEGNPIYYNSDLVHPNQSGHYLQGNNIVNKYPEIK